MKNLYIYLLLLLINYSLLNAQCFDRISMGGIHCITKKTNSTAWVWGTGYNGQLGNNGQGDSFSPIQATTSSSINKIAASSSSSYFITQNGALWGTGSNQFGALGIGSTSPLISEVFVQIGTSTNWKEIAPSDDFTLALKTNNTLWAWGHNNWYQLGDNTTNDRLTPVQIGTESDWAQLAPAKGSFSFALKNNGTLWCWGSNVARVLYADNSGKVFVPTQHNSSTDWLTVTCGAAHAVAIKTNGTLWAWGNYGYGETGIDVNNRPPGYDNAVPIQIGTANDWSYIAAGYSYGMAIKTNGTLWAWGANDVGQLGVGGTDNKFVPVQVGTDNNWATVSCGYQSTVALKTDGSLWAWGNNDYGQLGDGTTNSIAFPTLIPVAGCVLGSETFESKNGFKVSPNPSNSIFNLDLTSNYKTIVVADLLGKVVFSKNINNLASVAVDLSSLESGCYIAKLINDSGSVNVKLLKN